MKEGWKIKKLGEICDSINGLWKGKKEPFVTVGVLRSTNFTKDCRLNLSDIAYLEVEAKSFEKRKLQKGDIIVEKSGGGPNQPVGRVILFNVDGDFSFCNFTSALRIKDKTTLNSTYLHRYLAYYYFSGGTIKLQTYTIGLRNLDYNRYLQIAIPIPPLSEQQRIVEILDAEFAKIDALKANAEKSLQAAKDLFQSALKQALEPKKNWECKTVAEISENLDYKRIPVTKKDREDGIYPYYGASGIVDYVREYLFDEDLLLVSEDGANLIARSTPIAFSVSGKIWVNNHAHVLRFPTMDLQRFVEYFFANYDLSDYITGAAQPKLTQKALNSIIIEYPSDKEELAAIISRLDNLDERCKALQENYRKTIALCEDLKQALLRKAFNGEL